MGVALPDLWPRFSRTRRIRWAAVRAARPRVPRTANLRAGLLNHVAADRRFHALTCFQVWQRQIKAAATHDDAHPLVLDFLAHVAVELALDHRLVCTDRLAPDRFYDLLSACELDQVEQRVGVLADVNARGLAPVIRAFIARRFLRRYVSPAALVVVLRRVLRLTTVATGAPDDLLERIVQHTIELADPAAVWGAMKGTDRCAAAG